MSEAPILVTLLVLNGNTICRQVKCRLALQGITRESVKKTTKKTALHQNQFDKDRLWKWISKQHLLQ